MPPVVGIGGGGGQLDTVGRHGTDVSRLQWEDVVEGSAPDKSVRGPGLSSVPSSSRLDLTQNSMVWQEESTFP